MADPFLGQMMLVGFNFNPINWQLANGQTLSISQYAALFSLLGTYYGGNGTSNFQLPNMQGNVPIGYTPQGSSPPPGLSSYSIGQTGGTQTVTLTSQTTPSHTHSPQGAESTIHPDANKPTNNSFAESSSGNVYSNNASQLIPMSPSAISIYPGGSQPHNNMMPYLGMYWIICMSGVFPTRG
jgi:microcystin-dependent protein